MNFRKNFKGLRGGEGVIFIPKIYVADIGSLNIALFRRSQFQHDLPKKRGGDFFLRKSVFAASPVPMTDKAP